MAEHRTLKSPPIKHAIIDFRVKGLQTADVKALFQSLKDAGLSSVQESRPFEAKIDFEAGKEPTAKHTFGAVNGAIGSTNDQLYAVSFLDGQYSLTRNGKYSTFDDFVAKAKALWAVYLGSRGGCTVERIGIRFINQFRAQSSSEAMKLMKTRPKVADDMYGLPTEFVSRALLQMEGRNASAIVNHAWNSPQEGWMNVVLDIDVFRATSIPSEDDEGIWKQVDELRHIKNDLFFDSMDPVALRAFE